MNTQFQLVDVFHNGAFSGNPLAVILCADDLSSEEMQHATRWLNFSETAFILSPTNPSADYRVRIFTLEREMPFAGHPTLGSCHAWRALGGKPHNDSEIIQECGAGLVSIRSDGKVLSFSAPPLIRSGEVEESKIQEVANFLRIDRSKIIDSQWADNGPGWIVILLESAEAVLNINPLRDYPARIDVGVVGAYPAGHPTAFELRAFFSNHNGAIVEDPVTGSLNASTAQWLLSSGYASAPYIASQGTRLNRVGRIFINQDQEGVIWVGGRTSTHFSGICKI